MNKKSASKGGSESTTTLEQATEESRTILLERTVDNFIEQQRELEKLTVSVERGRADIAAGRYCSHEEAISRIRTALGSV